MLKIRRSRDRLIFNTGIHMPGKDDQFYNKLTLKYNNAEF